MAGGYESGRSMVEMLAVLAIISILGIAAIVMYRSVMDGYKADTLYNDIKTRLILANERKGRLFSTELGNQSTFGLPILLERNKPVMGYNKVTIINVPENICKRLLMKEWPADTAEKSKARIYVNNLPYPTKIQKCPDGLSTFAVAYRSSFALDNNLAKTCTENSECNACEKCLDGECKIDCGEGKFCYERNGEKSCVPGSCNDETGLCCPSTMDLCIEGEEPAGTESQCPCYAKQEGTQCKSCDANGQCHDDDRWCGEHGVCTDGLCSCEVGYARIKGVCIDGETTLENTCKAKTPVKSGKCYACTSNVVMPVFKEGTETTNPSVNYACEEVCPNRTFHSNRCGGASSNQLGICALTTAPAGKPLLRCSGAWQACPTGNASEQPAVRNDCYTNCSSDQTFINGAYCQSCGRTSTTYVTKAYNTQNSNANRCPNRIWDTTQCQNQINNAWVKCGENGLLSECTGGTSNVRCLYRLKTACEMKDCGEHGTCSVDNDVAVCTCSDNYYGDACENAPLTCQNGGQWDNINHQCDCTGTGYTGTTCEVAETQECPADPNGLDVRKESGVCCNSKDYAVHQYSQWDIRYDHYDPACGCPDDGELKGPEGNEVCCKGTNMWNESAGAYSASSELCQDSVQDTGNDCPADPNGLTVRKVSDVCCNSNDYALNQINAWNYQYNLYDPACGCPDGGVLRGEYCCNGQNKWTGSSYGTWDPDACP